MACLMDTVKKYGPGHGRSIQVKSVGLLLGHKVRLNHNIRNQSKPGRKKKGNK